MPYPIFEATKQAVIYGGERYADYIQSSLVEYIERGIRTLEETERLTLGELFIGNDGD